MHQHLHSPTCDTGGNNCCMQIQHNPRGWENKVIVNTNEETVIKPTRSDAQWRPFSQFLFTLGFTVHLVDDKLIFISTLSSKKP